VGFVYDGAQAIAEITGSAITATYLTGLQIDEVLARYAGTGNKTLLTDALGSVIAQANDQQGIQNFYAYTPYGEAQPLGPDDNNPIQYTGRENDQTGLYYYRARYYDPVLKRFISEDPIGLQGGLNVYVYVGENPISRADPTGQDFSDCLEAFPGCRKCIEEASSCREEHQDILQCLERGENTGISPGAHVLKTCVFTNPNCDKGCYQAILKCGYGPPTKLPKLGPNYPRK
jgi:RHS repeat-associated protein